ncbi:MAG: hypothetical protein ACJAZ9_001648 [Neolewinella sp.]|jgi:hypothetical protein
MTTKFRHWLKDKQAVRNGRRELEHHGITYHNFWELGPTGQTWFYRFLQRPAFQQLEQQTGLSFFSVFGRRRLVEMAGPGPKIFFAGENLANYPAYADHLIDEVDLALGFAHLDHDKYLRFPLWLLDIFPPEADLPIIQTRLNELSSATNYFANRPGFATLIARHDNNGIRSKLGDHFTSEGPVDYPGKFRNNNSSLAPSGYDAKLIFLKNYQFNLCPENTNAGGYVTEKLFHAIAAGCIPVYWGSDNLPEPEILNQEAILFYDPKNRRSIQHQLIELLEDEEKLLAFAKQPRFTEDAHQIIGDYFLKLEQALLKVLMQM